MSFLKSHIICLCCVLLLQVNGADGSDSGRENGIAIKNGGYIVTRNNTVLAQFNPDTPFVPASILKIATSLAALEILGREYRFQTQLFLTQEDDLYVKGSGDPFLTSEEIRLILSNIQAKGIDAINNIFLDDSAFQLETGTDGSAQTLNPYDAENSALAANFNTMHLLRAHDGRITSAEPQTPTLPLMRRLAAGLPPGAHRINITKDPENILIHTGQLFRALQKEFAIGGAGAVSAGTVPPGTLPLYVHESSKTLQDIIPALLLYSNNFIANQLFLACGAKQFSYPATWEKGRAAMKNFLLDKGLEEKDFHIAEGSGLSFNNKITPGAMLTILDRFKPYAPMLATNEGKLLKSGTLTGVYSYAGYFLDSRKHHSFVLILNQDKNTRDHMLAKLERIFIESREK